VGSGGVYIQDYVDGILAGNHDSSTKLSEHICHRVELDVTVQAKLQSSDASMQVKHAARGPSIDEQEADYRRNHVREQDVLALLTASPQDYLTSGKQVDVPGWTFSEVITRKCSSCGGEGRNTCGGCGGRGGRTCTSCGPDGRFRCSFCGGSGKTSNGSQTGTCGRCGGSGRTNCGLCGGRKMITCSRCRGGGSTTCEPCHAKGEIHTRLTRRHYAEISVGHQTLTQPPQPLKQFLAAQWNNLTSARAVEVDSHTLERVDANGAILRLDAHVDLDDAQIFISGRRFQISGANGGARPVIGPEIPFLSQLLELAAENEAKKLDKALSELSHLRLVREAVLKAEERGSSLENRKSASVSQIEGEYGSALTPQDRDFVAHLASHGLGKARSKAERMGWLKFMGECFLVTSLMMSVTLWLWGLNVYGYEGDEWGSSHIWAILAATGLSALWVFLGWRRVSRRVRDLGNSLGLQTRLKSRKGTWLLIGPLLAGGTTLLGWFTAFILFLTVNIYTGLFTPEVRESNWVTVEGFASSLPVMKTVVPDGSFKLYEMADPEWMVLIDELPAGTEIKVLGSANYGRFPVLVGDTFGWVQSDVVRD